MEKAINYYEELDIMNQQPQFLPLSEKSKNRLYLHWRNEKGFQCKMIGPETKCFCNHRFKEHEYLNPKNKMPICKAPKCKCKCFDYIPTHGAYDFKCLCKHSFKEHDCITRKCEKNGCKTCTGFSSAWTCSCGSKFIDHKTIIETYQQRKQAKKITNDMERLGMQLNHHQQEGSLLRPIKQDKQIRAYQKRNSGSLNISMKNEEKKLLNDKQQIQQIQQVKLKPKKQMKYRN